jgi:uncharacterized protein with HEPN domain
MYDTARRILTKMRGISRAGFDADENLRLAITHLLQTIGEAARRVSPQLKAEHLEIPWPKITGMRNRIVHDYTRVDFNEVWRVATEDIAELASALARFVPEDPPA